MKKAILFFALWLSMGALQVLQAQGTDDTVGVGQTATPCVAGNGGERGGSGVDAGGGGDADPEGTETGDR